MNNITLWDILSNNVEDLNIPGGIHIPMIQRDYAQGRNNRKATEIRKSFLNKILSGIRSVLDNKHSPLELDFIYGYVEAGMFIPLDGQQRLTTLYLLHWYLAFRDHQLSRYQEQFSKFTYQTRQSSDSFIRNLVSGFSADDHSQVFDHHKSFEAIITDKNWYYMTWGHDLTIRSAITMLDEIDMAFRDASSLFTDLIQPGRPLVVFHFLNIDNFGLSDDLYVKMNSRGKPLTNFENLKAELGRFIETSDFNKKHQYKLSHSGGDKSVDLETYFMTRIDTVWSDYFWNLKNPETKEFDDKLLNLLAFVALNETAQHDLLKYDDSLEQFNDKTDLTYYKFNNLALLGENVIISYIDCLDLLVSLNGDIQAYFNENIYLNKKGIIKSSFEGDFGARYIERILHYAVFKFLNANKNNLDSFELKKWDRLMRNLVLHTTYNSSRDYHDTITSIDRIVIAYTGDIYKDFLDLNIRGFDVQQIKEERLKIELMNRSADWANLINEAESHLYLEGQIIFLLAFSGIYKRYLAEDFDWIKISVNDYLDDAVLYFEKFKQLFTDLGLKKFEDEIFRRALLTKGDYLLYSTNYSLLIDNHRDISWSRLLRETGNTSNKGFIERSACLKHLFDDIQVDDVEGSLKRIIREHICIDWRKDFIDHPILMNTSQEKYIKFFDENYIYILKKSKYNKNVDPEVKSILLKELLLGQGIQDHEVEMGYVEALEQYGITKLKDQKLDIVYNHDGNKKYFIKPQDMEGIQYDTATDVLTHVLHHILK
ncbi:GmrSD restriction endonuclease domain-containing protein [Chitinophaga sp. 22321]|uniref:DUF262 domain-containing protein n=1 Tax=Chitinophaga hostae TaxID=2831022 RepID=A0ABS5IXG2_9BACT|nr:DUF262 domain-containing protein [Chitinophaga hostae]MBS0027667.1 DUF262 domain-containing protein [Chitinophaga hostae]